VLIQFHSLFFVLTKKYNGSGMDRPTKVAFLFLNLLNLMFVTALTYELRAGDTDDICGGLTGTDLESCTANPSPLDASVSQCVWEFAEGTCTARPIGGDTWKIAAFISAVTCVLTIPLNLLIKNVFFKAILPPSVRSVKEANQE
jgi:hypothetical protein